MAQERNLNLDFIKILAMVFVIGLHTGTKFYIGDFDVNRCYILTICGTAIPLFFTVSGYLLLGRKNVDWHYSIKKIGGIVRFVFVVCWIYWLIMLIITQEPRWDKLYKDPLGAFLMGGAFWQFWYFGAMCLIYLIYPQLNKIYNEKEKVFYTLFVCLIIFCFIIYALNIITPEIFEKKIPHSLCIWKWLLYFCLGGIVKKHPKSMKWSWVFILAVSYCIQLIIVNKINPSMKAADYFFSSPITLLYIYCLFQALNRLNIHNISKEIQWLSPLFLPVYTIHPFLIYNTQTFRHSFHAGYPIYWMLITIATVIVSWLIMQTKIGKWVFKI